MIPKQKLLDDSKAKTLFVYASRSDSLKEKSRDYSLSNI